MKYKFNKPERFGGHGWYVSVISDGKECFCDRYLHSDGEIRKSTYFNGKYTGYFPTKQDAKLAIKAFLDKQEREDCDGDMVSNSGVRGARGNGGGTYIAEVRTMTQRRLTDEELQVVADARLHIRQIAAFAFHSVYWQSALSRLNLMATNSTTDGKYYVEPEPPIPDGYRRAVAGDEGRKDCKVWKGGGYVDRWESKHLTGESPFVEGNHYIVPVDRIPTDEEALKRPVVMVRDHLGCAWHKDVLLGVRPYDSHYKFSCIGSNWHYCRFPYPSE